MSRQIEVIFSKRFTLRDDQSAEQPIQCWVKDMDLTYITHREIVDEKDASVLTLNDCIEYIMRGTKSPPVIAWLRSIEAKPHIVATAESGYQPDGLGAHWR